MSKEMKYEVFVEAFVETRSVREAAEIAGFAPSHGYKLFKKLRDDINERLQDELLMAQAEAVHTMKETMTKEGFVPAEQAQRLRAAEQVMDRGSLTKKQHLEVTHNELPAVMILPEKAPEPPKAPERHDEDDE